MATAHLQEVLACPSCGAQTTGSFCSHCGEKRPDPHDFSWKHGLHDAVHEFIHLDGKILQTLWLLLRRPGFLTAEYWAGRRNLYIRPLRLYIVIAAVHLIAMSSSFYRVDFFLKSGGGAPLERMMSKIAAERNITRASVESAINEKLATTYSVTQYCAVLGFALFPWALYRRRKPHYLQHAIFAMHVYGFYFVLTALVSIAMTSEQWRTSPLPLVSLAYLYFAVRRLYGESRWTALWKAVVLRLGLFVAEFLALAVALTVALFLMRIG